MTWDTFRAWVTRLVDWFDRNAATIFVGCGVIGFTLFVVGVFR